MKRSTVKQWLLGASLALLAMGMGTGTTFAETIKIGVASPFSGDLASYGVPARNAARLAAEKINAAGGVLGKQIELLEEDDVCEPNTAANVAKKLLGSGAVAIMGHLCSGATEAALPNYLNAKVIAVSPASTNPSLTLGGEYPNFFRTIPHDAAQANTQVSFAVNHLKIKNAVVLHDKGTYGKGLASIIQEGLEKEGVEVEMFEGVTPGAVDYSAVVRKVRRAKPDAVFFGGYHPEASKIVIEARRKQIEAPFISGDGVKDPSFLKITGKYAEGYYVSAPRDVTSVPMEKEVAKLYKERFDSEYGTFSLQGYAAIIAIANAIETAGGTDYEKVHQAMISENVDTPLGTISFDENGDVEGAGFQMYQVRAGSFAPVE